MAFVFNGREASSWHGHVVVHICFYSRWLRRFSPEEKLSLHFNVHSEVWHLCKLLWRYALRFDLLKWKHVDIRVENWANLLRLLSVCSLLPNKIKQQSVCISWFLSASDFPKPFSNPSVNEMALSIPSFSSCSQDQVTRPRQVNPSSCHHEVVE